MILRFALDKDDGKIDRLLNVAGEDELKDWNYLIKRGTKDKLSDDHLWISIIAKPSVSSFTRLDRLTCAFVLLLITMLANIIYYEADTSAKTDEFTITPQQIGIGIMTNLICFPPSFLLIQLFRRSKARTSKADDLKKNTKSDKKKKKKKLQFPWWFKIIAYILSIIFSAISLFFVIVKGISLGDEKVGKWLTSFLFSIFSSFVITQPIQIAAITFLLMLIFRKADDLTDFEENTPQLDDDQMDIEMDKNGQDTDQIFLYFDHQKTLNSQELIQRKEKYQKEKKAINIIKEITCYSIFLIILFLVCYSNKDLRSFSYKENLENVFSVSKSLVKVEKIDHLYDWIRNDFLISLYNQKNENLMKDRTSYLLGFPILRQLRVSKKMCHRTQFRNFCYQDYDVFRQDKESYGLKWSLNKSLDSDMKIYSSYKDSFVYKSSSQLETYPFFGEYSTYTGGGYTFELRFRDKNLDKLRQDIQNLQLLEWINSQTRAVFVELSVYNVNLNLFAYCTILFEILPTGNLIRVARIEPVILYETNDTSKYLVIAINVIYMLFIVFFMFKEIRRIYKLGLEYFTQIWNYVEWCIFVFSWATFSIFLYRQYAKNDLYEKIKAKDQIVRLQLLSYWNEVLGMLFGFLSFFGTLKFLKLLRTNKSISIFICTLKASLKDLISFSLIFFIIFLSFVQLIYLIEHAFSKEFSTFIVTFETLFAFILNKIPRNIYTGNYSLAKILISVAFYFVMMFLLINILITILTENFQLFRKDAKKQSEESVLFFFLKNKINKIMVKISTILNPKKYLNQKKEKSDKNSEPLEKMDQNIHNLIELINKSKKDDGIF